jgi:hypothetical protein
LGRIAKREISYSDSLVIVECRYDALPTCDFDPRGSRLRSDLVSQIIATISDDFARRERNHADAIVACDFMIAVTARFQFL